jgi:hypothetical protein
MMWAAILLSAAASANADDGSAVGARLETAPVVGLELELQMVEGEIARQTFSCSPAGRHC